MSGHWSTRPTITFRCGACGTTVSGFVYPSEVSKFAGEHVDQCLGFPPIQPVEQPAGEASK